MRRLARRCPCLTAHPPLCWDRISAIASNLPPSETLWRAAIKLPMHSLSKITLPGTASRSGTTMSRIDGLCLLSNRLCHRDRERGDAICGAAVHPELLNRSKTKGIEIAPLILHTGISNLESHEPPYKEFYRVPPETADLVNKAHEVASASSQLGRRSSARLNLSPMGMGSLARWRRLDLPRHLAQTRTSHRERAVDRDA